MLTTVEGTKLVCRVFFKNDKQETMEITNYQAWIIQRIFFKTPKRVLCVAATRAGKSLAVALGVILSVCFTKGRKFRIVAPTDDHTKIVMGYVIQHLFDSQELSSKLEFQEGNWGMERLKRELSKKKLTLLTDCEVMALSSNISGEGRSLIGWGATDLIVDEAEQIPESIMKEKAMRMLGDDPTASAFMIGNPVKYGYMYDKVSDPNWDFLRITWEDCVREGRMSGEFIEERRNDLLPNQFKVWYEADWPEELEDQLFTRKALDKLFAPINKEEEELLKTEPDLKRLGCDIARFGVDLTVLYPLVRYGEKWFVLESKVFPKQDLMKSVGAIIDFDRSMDFSEINVDDAGLGGGVTDRLREIDTVSSKVVAFLAGASPSINLSDRDKYSNNKAFWYASFARLAEKGLVRVVDNKNGNKLFEELKKMRYEFNSSGKLRVVDPEKSPDFADACNIGLYDGFGYSISVLSGGEGVVF